MLKWKLKGGQGTQGHHRSQGRRYYIGRTEFCSPEVDPEVLIPATKRLRVGNFYDVKITSSEEFDLYGELV